VTPECISRKAANQSKSEIRSSKSETNRNTQIRIQKELVWNFVLFDHLDLFRISDFEFFSLRIFLALGPG